MTVFLYNSKNIIKHVYGRKNIFDIFWLFFILFIPIALLLIYYFTYQGTSLEKSLNVIDQTPILMSVLSLFFSFLWLSRQFHYLKHKDNNLVFSRKDFLSSYVLISFVWYMFIYLYVIILLMCFVNTNIFIFKIIQFGQWFYANIMLFITCTTLSLLFIIWIRNINILLFVNAIMIIVSLILSDQFFQYELLANYNFISYISLVSPLNYSLSLISNSTNLPDFFILAKYFAIKNGMSIEEFINSIYFNNFYNTFFTNVYGLNIFDISNSFCINYDSLLKIVFIRWQKILNLVVPYIFSVSIWPIIYSFYYKNYNLDSLK